MEYLKSETGANVFILGIQPADISCSFSLSPMASQTVRECAKIITTLMKKEK